MKNKTIIVIITIILIVIGMIISYKLIAGNNIKNKTYEFLETKGYTKNDISNIEIKHSFLNKILSYNEWRIFVEFESEPEIIFAFTYRNNEIIKQGVTSDDLLDKDEIRQYDDKFKNGELKTQNINNSVENGQDNSFFGRVIESTATYIIVEPNENEQIRKSADKISIGLGKNNDALYLVGTNVKITYDGTVMETYPAKVKATKIEIKSAENFEIIFSDKKLTDSYKSYTILSKNETDKYDYNIYGYNGIVNIKIDDKDYLLKDALLENKITMEEIIQKANKDLDDNKITGDMYKDGGSMEYHYENYTIIKCHTLDGNRDVYIGAKEMTLNDVR